MTGPGLRAAGGLPRQAAASGPGTLRLGRRPGDRTSESGCKPEQPLSQPGGWARPGHGPAQASSKPEANHHHGIIRHRVTRRRYETVTVLRLVLRDGTAAAGTAPDTVRPGTTSTVREPAIPRITGPGHESLSRPRAAAARDRDSPLPVPGCHRSGFRLSASLRLGRPRPAPQPNQFRPTVSHGYFGFN